ncbi:MAG: hypothetical protein LBL35_00345 [Clostridiales bacterium]|nr:hypothetical protein [Clostridiales bacterium]
MMRFRKISLAAVCALMMAVSGGCSDLREESELESGVDYIGLEKEYKDRLDSVLDTVRSDVGKRLLMR